MATIIGTKEGNWRVQVRRNAISALLATVVPRLNVVSKPRKPGSAAVVSIYPIPRPYLGFSHTLANIIRWIVRSGGQFPDFQTARLFRKRTDIRDGAAHSFPNSPVKAYPQAGS